MKKQGGKLLVYRLFRRKNEINKPYRNLITQINPQSSISEQFRTVRTNIEFASVDRKIKTLMVTSARPGEGKSTIAANLAVAFAQQGKKVLLVDADLRKPTVQFIFQLENSFGMTTVLSKQLTFEKAILDTQIKDLYLLTSGPIPPNPAELLSSKAMDDMIKEARREFDFVIFDSPPVLAVSDAQVIANKCDGVILVINSGKTDRNAAIKAKDQLENAKAKLLGAVLNNKKDKERYGYYVYRQN